jgi:hypothetical protein
LGNQQEGFGMTLTKNKMALAGIVAGLALPAIGLAGNAGDGSDYGTQPGFGVSTSKTPCAGHGSFGAWGKDYNFAGGADGQETGFNNSGLCGNPQGSAADPTSP